jgi:translation initiation factor IF-2
VPEKKIRIYALAKELGLTNNETIDLCKALAIDVKSHSSSIEDAQADRVRRKAQQEGLIRPPVTENKQEVKAPPVTKTTKEPIKPKPLGQQKETEQALKQIKEESKERQQEALDNQADIKQASSKTTEILHPKPKAENVLENQNRLERQAPPKVPLSPSGKPIPPPPRRLLSPSGKPIPPPPRRLLSPSGKPIPPPPIGGKKPVSTTPSPPNKRGSRFIFSPTDAPKVPLSRPIRPATDQPPVPPRPSPFSQRGKTPPKKAPKRRKKQEELEPVKVTQYVPSNAPVPDYEVIIERASTAQEVGPKLNRTAGDVVRFLLLQGEKVTATQSLTDEMIELFAAEIGAKIKLVDPGQEKEAELIAKLFGNDPELNPVDPRPPVITVMGHVDHGKTLLLDKIRHSNVVASEAGGITQHIGAYQIKHNEHLLTFIDTPGHEAFTRMRARGAQITDIVVLVVAANDGVMPQTIEAINHAKAAKVPIVVAINKMDLPDADPNKVMHQLSEQSLVPEAWGGDTVMVPVSALTGEGIDDLLEHLILVAELEELKADLKARPSGIVLEAYLDVGRGPVANVIIKQGILRVSMPIVAGSAWGKIKALLDDKGNNIKEAYPSQPVQILGLSEPPEAGDEIKATDNLSDARELAETRALRKRHHMTVASSRATPGAKLEDVFSKISKGEVATLNIVLKADVQGSLEAITDSLLKLERDEVKINFVHRAVGGITENDVQLALASNSTIIGFNVRPDKRARELAEINHVEIRTYEIIYQVVEDVQKAILGLLVPEIEEVITGEAEVRKVFRIPKVGAVAGCYVRDGVITRGSKVRFLRDGVIIWKGTISSLKRFKDDVREVAAGFECGIGLSDFQDLKEGDIIETYEEKEILPT